MCYISFSFIITYLSRWNLIFWIVLKANNLGTAIYIELRSCLIRYFSANPLDLAIFYKTSDVKLIWSLSKSFPKNFYTISSQSINFNKSSTNFLLFSIDTFQKLVPVANNAQRPCFIVSNAFL